MSNSKNLISLGVIQFSNAVLPLIIFPYVLIVVGPELYSKIALSEALMFVIFTFVLYSFEVDGVSEIVHLGNQSGGKKLSMIFSKILTIRLLILTIFTILAALLYLLLDDIFYILLLFIFLCF